MYIDTSTASTANWMTKNSIPEMMRTGGTAYGMAKAKVKMKVKVKETRQRRTKRHSSISWMPNLEGMQYPNQATTR